MKSEAIVAKTRKLKAQWTPEFAQDLNAYQALDAEAELTSIMSEYISLEIDLEILRYVNSKMHQLLMSTWNAKKKTTKVLNSDKTGYDRPLGFYNTQGQWFQTLGTKMQKVSNKIHQKTLRGGANFVVFLQLLLLSLNQSQDLLQTLMVMLQKENLHLVSRKWDK